jgi:NTE family protein
MARKAQAGLWNESPINHQKHYNMAKQVKEFKVTKKKKSDSKQYHFRNLVFEGGGVKGIAYAGALDILEKENIMSNIQRVAGTSAGALVAVLIGLGYTKKDLEQILGSLDFKSFMDSSWGIVRDSKRLLSEYGWYKGDFFRKLVAGYIKEKTGNGESTFADIQKMKGDHPEFRDIYLIGSNLSTAFSEVFSYEHTPRMCIADAARISMSIPLFFAAMRGMRGDVYVDGGLLDNYAIKVFDRTKYIDSDNYKRTEYYEEINESLKAKTRKITDYVYNKETLGFRLDSETEIAMFRDNAEPPVSEIDSFFEYTKVLVTTLIDAQNNVHLHSDDWQRTIYIDTLGVNSTDFDIKDEMKTALVESGKKHTKEYLEWYNNDEEKANK